MKEKEIQERMTEHRHGGTVHIFPDSHIFYMKY